MRPQVSEEQAKQLAAAHWGWAEPLQASPLAGYDDTNIRLTGSDGREAVLKVHNAGDSTCESQYAEAQNALLGVLAAAGIPIPAPLPLAPPPPPSAQPTAAANSSGSSTISNGAIRSTDGFTLRVTTEDGQMHAVRMLSWCPGTLLVDVPQSAELYRQLGALLARVNRLLQGWQAPAWAAPALHRAFDWNLQQLVGTYARVRPHLLALPGIDVPLLDEVVQHFESATSAAGPALRQCIIHSDANERNVLVDGAAAAVAAAAVRSAVVGRAADGSGSSEAGAAAGGVTDEEAGAAAKANGSGGSTAPAADGTGSPSPTAEVFLGTLISGLIDWGDACWQWLAAEPAIAVVYMMLLDCNAGDPLPAAAAVVGGYEREMPLLAGERRLLRTLAMGRLAQSLCLGAYSASQQPDNTAYLLGTQKNGWRLLRTLWGLSDEAFLAALGPPPLDAAAAASQV